MYHGETMHLRTWKGISKPFDKGDSPLDPGPCRPIWMPRRLYRGTKESIRAWKQSGEVQWRTGRNRRDRDSGVAVCFVLLKIVSSLAPVQKVKMYKVHTTGIEP